MRFDPSRPHQRRDGKPAEVIRTLRDGTLVVVHGENDFVRVHSAEGKFNFRRTEDHQCDLVNIPERIRGWVAVRKTRHTDTGLFVGHFHRTRTDALAGALTTDSIIALIEIDVPEGHGLEGE